MRFSWIRSYSHNVIHYVPCSTHKVQVKLFLKVIYLIFQRQRFFWVSFADKQIPASKWSYQRNINRIRILLPSFSSIPFIRVIIQKQIFILNCRCINKKFPNFIKIFKINNHHNSLSINWQMFIQYNLLLINRRMHLNLIAFKSVSNLLWKIIKWVISNIDFPCLIFIDFPNIEGKVWP